MILTYLKYLISFKFHIKIFLKKSKSYLIWGHGKVCEICLGLWLNPAGRHNPLFYTPATFKKNDPKKPMIKGWTINNNFFFPKLGCVTPIHLIGERYVDYFKHYFPLPPSDTVRDTEQRKETDKGQMEILCFDILWSYHISIYLSNILDIYLLLYLIISFFVIT